MPWLIEAGLAGYAVSKVGALSGADLTELRSARVAMAGRHLVIKREVTRLVSAWHAAGLETLMFKGFALAEFVYPDPTWRVYSDVDVALKRPGDGDWFALTARAATIASSLGFEVHGRPEFSDEFDSLHGSSYVGPTILHLVHKSSRTNIDVHSRVVHNCHDENHRVAKQEMITEAVWRDSQLVSLAGVPVRIPATVDAAVVGLILNRTWSADSSHLRPHDYLDLATLTRSDGFSRSTLERRAKEFGAAATLDFFLRRCDPTTGTLVLRPPSAIERFLTDMRLTPEHGNRALQLRWRELSRFPLRVRLTIRELPNTVAHILRWRREPPVTWPGERLPSGETPLDRDTWRRTQFAVRRAFQLCGVLRPERRPDVATAALLYALRRQGVPVTRSASVSGANGEERRPSSTLTLHGEPLRPRGLGIRR